MARCLAFGTQYGKEVDGDFDEEHGFTGKEYDPDTGLYYYNARWYDADLGRFISEDTAADPNNPNLYSYCGNNRVLSQGTHS
jgi:RHS repeat-associated protein